jgi:type VI secretion system protein ImpK
LLAPEISRRQVAVEDRPDGTAIVIFEPLFASGSALVDRAQWPLLQRIAAGLNTTPAPQVRVIGHTDNVPITSSRLRFADNYQLSVARAEAVKQLLSDATRTPDRFVKAEGRGEREPIADNATAEGRARNRRVEILLLAASRRTGA